MEKYNKKCSVCGKEYKYCKTCKEIGSWRAITDTHECYQIHMIFAQVREDIITEKEAYDMFNRLGVTKEYATANFIPAVSKQVIRIISENTVEIKEDRKTTKKKTNYK